MKMQGFRQLWFATRSFCFPIAGASLSCLLGKHYETDYKPVPAKRYPVLKTKHWV